MVKLYAGQIITGHPSRVQDRLCSYCPAGSYSNSQNATNCQNCPTDTTTLNNGSTSVTKCNLHKVTNVYCETYPTYIL